MKKLFYLALALILLCNTQANADEPKDTTEATKESIENIFKYETGTVQLRNIATLAVPQGFKFMDSESSQMVLENLWGNPKDTDIIGMLFPENLSPLDSNTWAFVITYDDMGYVKEDDNDKIDYNELLKDMQKETAEHNEARVSEGFDKINLIGWASSPYYDKTNKALHWAKELQFGDSATSNTLNYDIRILGSKGILSYNAVADMSDLNNVKSNIDKIISSNHFNEGSRYADFNPSLDKVAAVTVGGLVAGKVLAKVGVFAIIAKFGKVIIMGILAFGGFLWRMITGKKKEEPQTTQNTIDEPTNKLED